MLKAVDLRCEYRSNPIGVFTPNPSLSWVLDTDKQNVLQSSYSIELSKDSDFAELFWKSGEVQSQQSIDVRYDGPALESSKRYFWRVKIRDNHGEESPWSESAQFDTAMFSQDEWKAVFITAEDEGAGASSAGSLFRKSFSIEKKPKSAYLYATAKGIYEMYCNGERIGDQFLTPGWTEYDSRLLYQSYDLSDLLKQGENALGAMVGPGWYKGDLASWLNKRNIYGDRTAILAQLRIEYEDGSIELISTDDSWKQAASPVTYSEIYHGEKYDARMEQSGWNRANFDDGAWKPAMLESKDLSAIYPQDGLPVKEIESFEAKSIFSTPEGDKVIDFEQNISGWVRFKVKGNAGDKVILRHAETLDADGNFYTINLRTAKQVIEYILKGGEEEIYAPHSTFQGFRYISVDAYPGEIKPENFTAIAISSDMRPIGDFSCSHPLLNQLISNVRWSMRDNFVDIPTDCPQRDERLGWTGDAQVFIRAASYLVETAPFFRKWLRDVSASQFDDGGIPHVVPDVLQNIGATDPNIDDDYGSTGWGDVATVAPWTIYKYFGDKDLLEEQYPSMKAWVDFIHSKAENGTIWNTGFHFGDWVALDAKEGSYFGATPNDLTATAYYAYSTELLIKAARVLSKDEDIKKYEALHAEIAKAYAKEFFTPSGRLAARTQTAHILSLRFGLTPEAFKKRTIDTLIELLQENDGHLLTGFLGTPYFCQVLSENGHLDQAYDLLLKEDYPSWLYQITKGATTVWEHWDGLKPDGTMWSPDMNSFNHYAYGAVVDWIFSTIGGLDSSESAPGFAKFLLTPQPGGNLSWAETRYRSGYGDIALRWEIKDAKMKLSATIPANTTATLTLPGAAAGKYAGIDFIPSTTGATATLGSGSYQFEYDYN